MREAKGGTKEDAAGEPTRAGGEGECTQGTQWAGGKEVGGGEEKSKEGR